MAVGAGLDDAVPGCVGRSFDTIGGAGLGVDVADVTVDSVRADHEFIGYLLIATPGSKQSKDFDLPR
jgi:hypothetical protein